MMVFEYEWTTSHPELHNQYTDSNGMLIIPKNKLLRESTYVFEVTAYSDSLSLYHNSFDFSVTANITIATNPVWPPEIVSVVLSPDFTTIDVTFNSSTNAGGMTAATEKCTSLLSPNSNTILGYPNCTWTASNRLVISGLSNTFQIGVLITLQDRVVKSADGNSAFVPESTLPLQANPVLPSLLVDIQGPNIYSPECETLTLSSVILAGSAGRVVTYEWSLLDAQDAKFLASAINTNNSFSELSLEGGNFDSGRTYTFLLTVKNWLNTESVAEFDVRTSSIVLPLATLKTNFYEVEYTSQLELRAIAALSLCTNAVDISVLWTHTYVIEDSSEEQQDSDIDKLLNNKSITGVQSYDEPLLLGTLLIPARTYVFTFIVTDNNGLKNEDARTITVLPIPRPYISYARFDDSATFLQIVFAARTNIFNAKLNQISDCNGFLSEDSIISLANSTCTWVNRAELRVFLDSSSTIAINDTVEVLEGLISSDGFSKPASLLKSTIEAPLNPPTPTAVLTGPQVGSYCADIFLEGGQSFGTGGRPLTYKWAGFIEILSNQDSHRAINNAIKLYDTPSTVVPRALLSHTFTVLFQLQVTNWVGGTDTASLYVDIINFSVPDVHISGLLTQEVSYNDDFRMLAVTTSGCDRQSDFAYQWSSPDKVVHIPNPYLMSLYVPRGNMMPGETYTFRVIVTSRVSGISNYAEAQVQVTGEIYVEIKYGHRLVSISGDGSLYLDATDSFDPADRVLDRNERSLLQFEWSCILKIAGTRCFTLDQESDIFHNTAEIVVSNSYLTLLPEEDCFVFTVIGSKNELSASSSVEIRTTNDDVPNVAIVSRDSVEKVSISDKVYLHAILLLDEENRDAYSYSWTIVSDNVDSFGPDALLSGLDNDVLVLAPNLLGVGNTYAFQVEVSIGTAPAGVAMIYITTNEAPSSGRCIVEPSTGDYDTEFRLECAEWTDNPMDYPLEYAYYLDMNGTLIEFSPFQGSNVLITQLPVGPQAQGYTYEVVAVIRDRFKMSTQFSVGVLVAAPVYSNSTQLLDRMSNDKAALEAAVLSGDMTLLVASLTRMSSVLEQDEIFDTEAKRELYTSYILSLSEFVDRTATISTSADLLKQSLDLMPILIKPWDSPTPEAQIVVAKTIRTVVEIALENDVVTTELTASALNAFWSVIHSNALIVEPENLPSLNSTALQLIMGDVNALDTLEAAKNIAEDFLVSIRNLFQGIVVNMADGEEATVIQNAGITFVALRDALGRFANGTPVAASDAINSSFVLPPELFTSSDTSGASVGILMHVITNNLFSFSDVQSGKTLAYGDVDRSPTVSLDIYNIKESEIHSFNFSSLDNSSLLINMTFTSPLDLNDPLLVEPSCRFWDESAGNFSDEGCVSVEYDATFIVCECDHVGSFGTQQFTVLPPFVAPIPPYIDHVLEDIIEYPSVPIAVGVMWFIYIVTALSVWREDMLRYKKDPTESELVLTARERGWRGKKTAYQMTILHLMRSFRYRNIWCSFYFHQRADNLPRYARVTELFVVLCGIFSISAFLMGIGGQNGATYQDILSMSLLSLFLVLMAMNYMLENSGIDKEIRLRLKCMSEKVIVKGGHQIFETKNNKKMIKMVWTDPDEELSESESDTLVPTKGLKAETDSADSEAPEVSSSDIEFKETSKEVEARDDGSALSDSQTEGLVVAAGNEETKVSDREDAKRSEFWWDSDNAAAEDVGQGSRRSSGNKNKSVTTSHEASDEETVVSEGPDDKLYISFWGREGVSGNSMSVHDEQVPTKLPEDQIEEADSKRLSHRWKAIAYLLMCIWCITASSIIVYYGVGFDKAQASDHPSLNAVKRSLWKNWLTIAGVTTVAHVFFSEPTRILLKILPTVLKWWS